MEGILDLKLHPDAESNFNEKANNLITKLAPEPKEMAQNHTDSFTPDIFVSQIINGKDIKGEIRLGLVDYAGNEVAKFFEHDNLNIGLIGESFKDLFRLAETMQRTNALRSLISIKLLTNLIFDWLRDNYKNVTNKSMTEYVISECEKLCQELEIWIPIALTHIQSETELGKIIIKIITKEKITHWQENIKVNSNEKDKKIQQYFGNVRKKLQGLAAATIKLSAEPQRAKEIALEESEKSISLLRFFAPSMLLPEIVSYCTVLGKENLETIKYLAIKDDKLLRITDEIVDKASQPWIINNEFISMIKNEGLDNLHNLLIDDQKSKFKETLLNSLLIYTKSCLHKDLSDKLIYILVALESILLKNENEPIQQNISERLAFFIARKINERKEIIKNVKRIYDLRSSFIHHAHSIDDIESLRVFMHNVWSFFHTLIKNIDNYTTKEHLIKTIEERKLA